MAFSYTCLTLQRCVIPVLLVLAALFRPVGISFVYLLMFFISPLVPVGTRTNFKGSVTAYFSILITISTILLICHAGLQLALLLLGSTDIFSKCSFTEQLVRHIGFVSFKNLKPLAIVEWLAPEAIMFIASLSTFWVIKKITSKNDAQLENGETEATLPTGSVSQATEFDEPNFSALIKISSLLSLLALFFAAILRPSVPGGFYFLVFLLSASYMATYKKLQRNFALLLRVVMIIMVLHVFCIVAYQNPWIQKYLDYKHIAARLIGLEPLVTSDCKTDIRVLVFNTDYKLDSFLSPIAILLAYYVFALTSKSLLNTVSSRQQMENGSKQIAQMMQTHIVHKRSSWTRTQRLNVSKHRDQRKMVSEPTENTPLVRQSGRKQLNEVGINSAATDGEADIPLGTVNTNTETDNDHKNSLCDQICYGFISVGGFIYENSYIFTNILMMAWSIVYHSWLTFALLLWGNVLWMLENQRNAMMRSTPFIVIYAELLLLAQYIYGMDLNNDELPTKVDITGINLEQIGFSRPQENGVQPCVPLIVKTAFLLMFWVTLRQFFKEKLTHQRTKYTTGIFSPLRSTREIDQVNQRTSNKKTSKILKKIGSVIKNLLVRLWIWLVILVILLCALTGRHMTGFRICYMALFLFFLLVFQSSSQVWVKVMYGFWIFLIFYAMSILILIYTYQFDKFDEYWNDYLNISTTLQYDIGLEIYETKDLFLHLLSPTLIVILTAIQVHYFHKRFIASLVKSDTVGIDTTPTGSQRRRVLHHAITQTHHADFEIQFSTVTDLIRVTVKKLLAKSKAFLRSFKRFIWRLLEFHFIKVVYIFAFVCCINQICVLHLPFLFLCVIGLFANRRGKVILSFAIAFVATLIILVKMIYQVAYLDHSHYNVHCPNVSTVENNAEWFGLKKASPEDGGLIGILRFYIIYMIITTIHAVIRLRQNQYRDKYSDSATVLDKVMFPNIRREDAEKNITGLLKYLCNYGFYKFGMEICLIWLVATITFRQDIMASLYAIWLIVFMCLYSSKNARIWNIFQVFIAVAIILQYCVLLNFPPSFCIEYPWNETMLSAPLQGWAMLPGHLHYNHAKKLMFDFILLMLVHRQRKVFLIEKRIDIAREVYPGGNNDSVVEDIKNLGLVPFENPTRDFLSNVRNYLDILKNIVLCGLFWVTLAMIFLAGTNIGDLLALGYLISAMIFLWLGSDFYLKPINVILRYWNLMIYYNVANIVLKTFMQLTGCIFMQYLTTNCCWLLHLFSISCASQNKFVEPDTRTEEEILGSSECPPTKTQVLLIWDAVCFALLICQLRIFKSHYFCHIILDSRANSLLASRGAVLIEELRQKQVEYRQEHEKEVLLKIKRKMEKIRATQQQMLQPFDKPSHFDEEKSTIGTNAQYASSEDLTRYAEYSGLSSLNSLNSGIESVCVDNLMAEKNSKIILPTIDICPALEGSTEQIAQNIKQRKSELLQANANNVSANATPCTLSDIAIFEDSVDTVKRVSQTNYELFEEPNAVNLLSPTTAVTRRLSGNSNQDESEILTYRSNGSRRRRISSVGNAVSWNEVVAVQCATPKESLKNNACEVSTDADIPVTLRQKSLNRRHLSMGNASYLMDEFSALQGANRRYSNLSWAKEKYQRSLSMRPNSWGPVANLYFMEYLRSDSLEARLHGQSVRAGDYYMFDEVDEKFKLDVIDDTVDYLDAHEKITETDKKLNRRKIILDQKKLTKHKEDTTTKDDEPSTSKEVVDAATMKDDIQTEKSSDDEDMESNPIVRLLESFLYALTIRLNRYSRSYRYVNKVLLNEKKQLRQQTHMMGRLGRTEAAVMISTMRNIDDMQSDIANSQNVLENNAQSISHDTTANETIPQNITSSIHTTTPQDDTETSKQNNSNNQIEISFDTIDADSSRSRDKSSNMSLSKDQDLQGAETVYDICLKVPSTQQSREGSGTLSRQWSLDQGDSGSNLQFDEQDFTAREHNILIELLIALYYVLLSNTDVVCFMVVFIYQISNASIISLPLPIMVFLWGTLSLPRPTKTFWVTLIAYTQAIVVIKCIFQFKLIWSNYINLPNQPLTPAKIFGVELNPNYAIVDIILLIVLFFHRFMLKAEGLWKSTYRDDLIVGQERLDHNSEYGGEDKSTETDIRTPRSSVPKERDSIKSYQEHMQSLKRKAYATALRQFFTNLVRKTRMPTDVYALMFLCDFINFLVLLFNFSAFASQQVDGESGGVQTYLAENKVPIPFLIMLLAQFLLIVIDRALYLRKALVPKIVFHFFSVIVIHVWMFFVVPAVTERSFYVLTAPMVFYVIKCCYLLLSSYQIKCGYPKRVLGNFLTKGFSLPNMLSFKAYTLIPFLYELRTILDWVCVDTTMTLFDWLKMEDIFTEIYFIKCSRQLEHDFPAMRATKKALLSKLLLGGGIIFVIVVAIWGPLCLFALSSAVGQANVPNEVSVSVRIGPYDPIYATINRESISVFNEEKFQAMKDAYMKNKQAIAFLSGYDAEDIAAVKLAGNSPSLWNISPPDKFRLLNDLKEGRPLTARFTYSLTRVKPDRDASGTVSSERTMDLKPSFEGIPTLIDMLEGTSGENDVVIIPNFIPKFLKVLNKGEVSVVSALMSTESDYRPLAIKTHAASDNNSIWWEISDHCADSFSTTTLSKIPLFNCESGIVMYTFNDKKFPSTFSFITKGGIIGLYTTLVLVFSRVLKSFITGKNRRIMFEDLPYVDRVLQLCLDIYLVREALEFTLEEDLFAKLIFLYRSPETLIKWTRPQEEMAEEEAETESIRSRPN